MSEPIRRKVTTAQVAHEQYGIERRGHDAGELAEPAAGEHSQAADDYSTSGLFRDENFSRDSCGDGEGRTADHSWEGPEARPADLYRDTGESDFTVRKAAGLDEELEASPREEESTGAEVLPSRPPTSPVRRRLIKT